MEDMVRLVEKSCAALNAACSSTTMSKTTPSARFDACGLGLPSGFLSESRVSRPSAIERRESRKPGCAPGDEAENGGDSQQRAKAAEKVPEDL